MFDFQIDAAGDFALRITDRKIAAVQSRSFARLDDRCADVGGRLVAVNLFDLQALELLGFRPGPGGRAGPGFVLVDEFFQLPPLGQDRGVRALVVVAAFDLVFEKGVDPAGKHRQFAARQIERVRAGGPQKGPIVRYDQATFGKVPQEVLEEDLRPQIEKVGRFVEQQQIRLVEQQGRQFHPGLPAPGELGQRPFEIRPLEFELAGHFAALPVGLAAVAHEEFERGFAGLERVVLAQISQPQLGMADHFALVEFFIPQQHAQQRRLAGPVAPDEADFDVVDDRGFGAVEQDLVAVAFVRVFDLQQHGHTQ